MLKVLISGAKSGGLALIYHWVVSLYVTLSSRNLSNRARIANIYYIGQLPKYIANHKCPRTPIGLGKSNTGSAGRCNRRLFYLA
ncbi:hypothetical protein BKA65DRAFT_498452 [Rhexocercosporidium sp. MPI-PUGE-AT-0058]|nr:hypothetical protein BKA65DRAFT_498452 [Rhexocercosporidium sp. MPI-PUGE-AT-0058]